MGEVVLSEDRATGLRRLLLVTCGMAGVLVVIAALLAGNGYGRYAVVVLGCAALVGGSARPRPCAPCRDATTSPAGAASSRRSC